MCAQDHGAVRYLLPGRHSLRLRMALDRHTPEQHRKDQTTRCMAHTV